jgi:hypothetical protein
LLFAAILKIIVRKRKLGKIKGTNRKERDG